MPGILKARTLAVILPKSKYLIHISTAERIQSQMGYNIVGVYNAME